MARETVEVQEGGTTRRYYKSGKTDEWTGQIVSGLTAGPASRANYQVVALLDKIVELQLLLSPRH
jgi:hypothetical protein